MTATPSLLRSSLFADIGVPHAFTTRQGGVSSGAFSSLNFGNPSELPPDIPRDPVPNIAANFRIVQEGLNSTERSIVQVHQVHGRASHVHVGVSDSPLARTLTGKDPKADAIVTRDATSLVAIRTADCCPVLLSSTDGRVVAAVHAGWRGVISGVALTAVADMQALGATQIAAAIGPCISVEHFEIGPDVSAEFRRVFGDAAPLRAGPRGKDHADLQTALELQLRSTGITAVDVLAYCTVASPELFFSHRRDKGVTGRMVALIGPRA